MLVLSPILSPLNLFSRINLKYFQHLRPWFLVTSYITQIGDLILTKSLKFKYFQELTSPGASFSKSLKSSSDLKQGKDNGYQGD